MSEQLLTPSKISGWLGCAHSMNLRNSVAAGVLDIPVSPLGELAKILAEKGLEHEANCLEDYEAMGKTIYRVPGRGRGESFTDWVVRIGDPLSLGFDVVYQMPFIHNGIRGIADYLVKVDAPFEGYATYEPVDAKLTRTQAKPGHALQLCFYAEAIEAKLGHPPRNMHIWLGSGSTESLLVEEFLPYWRRIRRQLEHFLSEDAAMTTEAKPCDECEYCEFQDHCTKEWRTKDSLVFVATSREKDRAALEGSGVRTVVELAKRSAPVPDLGEGRLERLSRQASLQIESREHPKETPAFELVTPTTDPVYGHGFEFLPAPNEGDVFFDFEGDPFWSAESDLMFLAGLYYYQNGSWLFDDRWAHSLSEQTHMVRDLVHFFANRRLQYPEMHVYHYNHTERSTIERLMRESDDQELFASLVASGLFVDLFTVAKNAVRVGVESYGLKNLEGLVNYVRSGDIGEGAGAVVEYEQWMKCGEEQLLANIARYNEDDVRATKALRDWLVAVRPASLPWRPAVLVTEEYELDTDALVEALHDKGEATPEYLLGDLLQYWRRERSADTTPKYIAMQGDYGPLYDNLDYIANVTFVRDEAPTGRQKTGRKVFTWPEQKVERSLKADTTFLYSGPDVPYGSADAVDIDLAAREITFRWGDRQELAGGLPTAVVVDDFVHPAAKATTLKDIAQRVLDYGIDDERNRLVAAILRGDPPRFSMDGGPANGVFTDQLEDMYGWVMNLDESVIAIQGPPGTGKTYSGSHLIHYLVSHGFRVGVMSMSHSAIDNLMKAARKVLDESGASDVQMLRWQDKPDAPIAGLTYSKKKAELGNEDFRVIGGTAWMWANDAIRDTPVDVLLIDEAGQLSLADALVASNGARNIILLGDPQQLAQVAKAEHPGKAGRSVLDHLLEGHPTITPDRGVFLSVTRRMHPSICDFISRQIYEGRLTAHESCAQQTTEWGSGLRWIEAVHSNCSTESLEEANVVLGTIRRMLGTPWTNERGVVAPLTPEDFMVVAPYNDQVNLMRRMCSADEALRGVQVGTVDKFQGREAAVTFFAMTTSSSDDMPRGPEFLFSRNRLNVAVSRARCLAFLVCTEDLLNSRARDIEDMRLIGTLSAFVESAVIVSADS